MDGWGIIAVFMATAVCIVLIVVGSKTRIGLHHHTPVEDDAHPFGFERDAKLLGTIPSEDEDIDRISPERRLSEFTLEEEREIDLRHQRPKPYRYMDEPEPNQHTFRPEESIEQCISHQIVEDHREEAHFALIEDEAVVDRLVAEGHDLVRDLNQEFGHELFEPRIADRLFNTNVLAVLGAARSTKKIDFRTMKMISVMRSFARAPNGGRHELSKVMATRILLGTARLTVKELESINHARRLFGDEFAEAAGYVDHLSRTEEIVAARRLGVTSKESRRDREKKRKKGVDIERNSISRSLDRRDL